MKEETKIMTNDQIERIVGKLRATMHKYRYEITSGAAQKVLRVENVGIMMFTPFRERAETLTNIIIRKVRVNLKYTRQEAIDATLRMQYTDRKVVNAMPKASANEVKLVFFKPDLSERNGYISDDDLEKEYELRGLKSADPISVAAFNKANPDFADEKPHVTRWKDAKGKWCCAAFNRRYGGRAVGVGHHSDRDWNDYWWFVGVRK